MKQLLYFFLLILCGCTTESFDTEDPTIKDGQVTLRFNVDIPEPQPMADTRAVDENLISTLYLLVFDENERFISRHQATLTGNNFVVTLPQSNEERTIHFVANYDWTGFDDVLSLTKDEGEIIAPLKSTNLIFWQRVSLLDGITSTSLSAQPISLIRNMAKFSLDNLASSGLTNAKFALFNQATIGSVAPFNTANNSFESVITEPVGVLFTNFTPFGVDDIYTFERKNSTVTTNTTYVIVEGTYDGATYYYKIDIIDDDKNMYDIQRNVWFKIIIESVTMGGYTTVDAAKSAPASNNISASVLLQSYPTISDGSFVLSVDKTTHSFTQNGQMLLANAIYETVGGVLQNNLVTVTLVQDPNFPVVDGTVSFDIATGDLTANIHNIPANGVAHSATIKIVAGYLSRTIRLLLHAPFTFQNISITPTVVPNTLETPAVLKFTIPAEAEYLLPFNCFITTAYLTPSFGNIEVVYENGLYKYKWKVTAVGEQTINLQTNTTNAAETVFIEANLFERGEVTYTNNNGVYRFSNVVLTPNRVDFGVGNSVRLKFTVPTAGTYNIYTSNLNPSSGGVYTHTASAAGEQVIDFTTNKQNVSETIRLTGTGYLDHTIDLKNQLVDISGVLTYRNSNTIINGQIVNITVNGIIVSIITTSTTGAYQTYIEANIGDVVTFSYRRGGTTYTATEAITSPLMTISENLL
jgi:hypothetical protein